jgi:type VI secretion system protein ImpC
MELNFGFAGAGHGERKVPQTAPFRLAVLGDFSGGANRGRLEVGADLARRKPIRVDVDNIDKVIGRLGIKVQVDISGEGPIEFAIRNMDDFHPDQIFEQVELFEAMGDLQQRLRSKSGFQTAARELAEWKDEGPTGKKPGGDRLARGAVIPRAGALSEFAQLVEREVEQRDAAEVAVEALLKDLVAPYIVSAKTPEQAALLASVAKARAIAMRKILHHPDFQTLESIWRSVDMLTRRLETGTNLQIVLYDISAEEFAADLASTDAMEETGLYKLLVEQPALDEHQGPLSVFLGAYVFEQTVPQAELLGRIGKLAESAGAPFVSSLLPSFLDVDPDEADPDVADAWAELRDLDEARYLALVLPRYLLRQPYGERTDPIDSIEDFEEFTRQAGLKGMLWGNPAFIAGLMLAQTYAKQGAKMNLGSILTADDIPVYFYVDEDDDQIALPSTERLISERTAARIKAEHLIPLLTIKGRPEVRLAGFTSLEGDPLAGRWPLPAGATMRKEGEERAPTAPKPAKVKKPKAEKAAEAAPAAAAAPPPAAKEEPAAEGGTGDSELDALLAGLDATGEAAPNETGEGDMDPELAELLKGL